jgi:hypothetical protein
VETPSPPARISWQDYEVIACVLLPYAQIVPHTVTELFEQDAILKTVEALRQRTLAVAEGKQLLTLTEDELSVVLKAIRSFVENVARFFPPTTQREEIIMDCEKLHLYFSTLFAPLSLPLSDSNGKGM